MTTNATITVYNRYLTGPGEYSLRRTVIRGVWWHADQRVTVSEDGVQSGDAYKVRIPLHADFGGSAYVPPWEFEGAEGTWTLNGDDYVMRGEGPEVERLKDLQKEKYPVFRITSWADDRFGSLPHWRIGGV